MLGRRLAASFGTWSMLAARPHEVALALVGQLRADQGKAIRWLKVLEDVHWADEATLDVLRVAASGAHCFGSGALLLAKLPR